MKIKFDTLELSVINPANLHIGQFARTMSGLLVLRASLVIWIVFSKDGTIIVHDANTLEQWNAKVVPMPVGTTVTIKSEV